MLINLLTVRKKNVTLKTGESCTLADLFPEQYELLPDTSGLDTYGGYKITTVDKKGVLSVSEDTFPGASDDAITLRDFKIGRKSWNGSAQIAVSFGGRVYKATVTCK